MSKDKIIVVDNITKIYNMYNSPQDRLKEVFSRGKSYHSEFYALKNISFTAEKGEVIGIMGRNGAGKSTLLKIITGVLQPTNGEVAVSGRISSLLELGAGFNPEYTGMENIYFYGTIMGVSKAEMDEKVTEILAFAEIGDFINQPVKSYSSGMFARLAFSCAINVEPDVLIVDEILSVGDIRFQTKCFKKFHEFKKKGVTILYVGHDIYTMRTFCDRCIWLNKGEFVADGDPTEVSARYIQFMNENETFRMPGNTDSEETSKVENSGEKQKSGSTDSHQPIAHWGSRTGLIRDVSLSVNGKEVSACDPKDDLTISFRIPHMDGIDYNNLSVSFSIKSKDGIDLIVRTTYDANIKIKEDPKGHTFRFTLRTYLTNGDYYLALGVEKRVESEIIYYEYIEGAKYFKVFREKDQGCLFLPDIDIEIRGDHEDE